MLNYQRVRYTNLDVFLAAKSCHGQLTWVRGDDTTHGFLKAVDESMGHMTDVPIFHITQALDSIIGISGLFYGYYFG